MPRLLNQKIFCINPKKKCFVLVVVFFLLLCYLSLYFEFGDMITNLFETT